MIKVGKTVQLVHMELLFVLIFKKVNHNF